MTVHRPDGSPLVLGWGRQLDLREVTAAARAQIEDDAGEISDAALAGYIAKYATKAAESTGTVDRRIGELSELDKRPGLPGHTRRLIQACHALDQHYPDRKLWAWAHMLGFRGHFLTKSQRYSVTFKALRGVRRTWRLLAYLAQLDTDTTGENAIAPDLDTITVINDWWPVHYGHRDDAERELAAAIAERHQAQRRSRITRRAS
jgi:hypothetical protein